MDSKILMHKMLFFASYVEKQLFSVSDLAGIPDVFFAK